MRRGSLPLKINTAILVTATVIALVFWLILFPVERKRYTNEIDRIYLLLDTIYKQKLNDLANEIFADQQRALRATLAEIKGIRGEIVNVCLFKKDGKIILCHDSTLDFALVQGDFAGLGKELVFKKGTIHDLPLGAYVNSIEVIGDTVGYIAIYYNLSAIEKEGRNLLYVFFFLLLATTLIMAFLQNIFLFQAIIKPVSLLRAAMRRVEEGYLGESVRLPWKDEIGEVGKAFNDMSRKLLESKQDIEKAEKKYRDIFEQSIEGIFQSKADHGRFITVNPSLVQLLGFEKPEELLGVQGDISRLFLHPSDWLKFRQDLDTAGRIVGFETQLTRRNGQAIWVAISARQVIDADGQHVYNEGSIVDITERRQREQAERAREAAEAANNAKSEFLAKMSHEIRTPLNAILGFAEILEAGLEDQQRKSYAQTIKASGNNLLRLINDILDLSKIEAGKMELLPTEVDIRQLLGQMTEVFSAIVQQKGIQMRGLVEPEVPRWLLLDIVRVRQILFNLIGNAVKFTDQGFVEIRIAAGPSTFPEKVDLSIQVTDTGIGIAPESGKEIFESFKQELNKARPAGDGTGLGLAISKNLAEAMGGAIDLRSQPGKGSIFTVSIPGVTPVQLVEVESLQKDKEEAVRASSFREATVLIADDLEINRKLLKAAFVDSPVRIIEAQDGRSAVALAAEYLPDIILMDIRMPELDGHEAYREIRKNNALQAIPIVALTASGMKEDVESIRRTGFEDYLIRPFNLGELKEKIAKYLAVEPKSAGGLELPDGGELRAPGPFDLAGWTCPEEVAAQLIEIKSNQWRKIRQNQRISDIRAFSEEINGLGISHNLAILTEYGRVLAAFVETFDIDNIQKTLDYFPELLGRIKH